MSDQVPASAIPILQDPPFVLWLVWLGTAIGFRLLLALRTPVERVSALERGVLSCAVGLGLLQFLPFALGMSGHLTRTAIWVGLLALTAVFARDMARVARGVWRATRRPRPPLPGWIRIGLVILAIPLAVAFLQALCPPTDPDGVGYHLTAPRRWLEAGSLRYLPTLWHSNSPMGVEMLYTIALATWSGTAAKLIHYALGLLALLAIYLLGRRVHSPAVGFAAAAIWLRTVPKDHPLIFFTWANVDLGIVLEMVCAALAYLVWRREGGRGWLVCAALCAGFAASFKLTGAFVGVALGALVMVELGRRGAPMRRAAGIGAGFVALALLPLLPWLWKVWAQTGNPVYPLLSNLFPTRDWSAETARAFDAYFKLWAYDWQPAVSWGPAARQVARVAALAATAALGIALAWCWRGRDLSRLAALAAILTIFGILGTGLNIRLLLPMFALACVLLCAGFATILARNRLAQGLLLALLAFNGAVYVRKSFPNPKIAAAVASGVMTRAEYLDRYTMIGPIWDYVNAQPRQDGAALVAALNATHGPIGGLQLYCDRDCYVTDAYLQGRIHLDTWQQFVDDVRGLRVAYLVVPERVPSPRIGPDSAAARNELPFARRLEEQYGRLLLTSGDFRLYRLEVPAGKLAGVVE